MTNTNKTLYIPLYGKAFVSKQNIILKDEKAEEIWAKEQFALKRKSKSKWLRYFMAMRRKVFDNAASLRLKTLPGASVLHIGRGMDSRYNRITPENLWYDIDFESVIDERRKYYTESSNYKMLSADATQPEKWLCTFDKNTPAIVIMEGVSMYIEKNRLKNLILQLQKHFSQVIFIADFYTNFGVNASKLKNPVQDVGAVVTGGMDKPEELLLNKGIVYAGECNMTPARLIGQLPQKDRAFFKKVMAGNFSKKLYRMFIYNISPE